MFQRLVIIVAVLFSAVFFTATRADAAISYDHKLSIIEHELTHAIGPGHWDKCPSLMGPNCGTITAPTTLDKNRVNDWYYLKIRPLGGLFWSHRVVCIQDHAWRTWPVYDAFKRINVYPYIWFVYVRDDSCLNKGFDQVIRVYADNYYATEGKTWYGNTYWWHQSYDENGDGINSWDLEKAEVRLNNQHL